MKQICSKDVGTRRNVEQPCTIQYAERKSMSSTMTQMADLDLNDRIISKNYREPIYIGDGNSLFHSV